MTENSKEGKMRGLVWENKRRKKKMMGERRPWAFYLFIAGTPAAPSSTKGDAVCAGSRLRANVECNRTGH